jgi:hypothetical protein
MRRVALTCVVFAVGGLLVGVAAASRMATPAGGTIRLFVVPGKSQGNGTIVITGAIGDYGKTTGKNKKGIGTAVLHKGTFQVNLAAISKKLNNSKPILLNTTTCSFVFGATAPVTLLNGTGLYKGISGTVMLTETFAAYGPLYKSGAHKGKCNTSNNATPTAQYGSVQGVGTVKFS